MLLGPGLVLAMGLGLTSALWHAARDDARRALEDEFRFWVSKVAGGIEERLDGYVQVLRGVVGLLDSSVSVTRQEFHRYVAALRLQESHPGMQGIGFTVYLPANRKAEHIAAVRKEGFPDYRIWPEGERAFYTAVIYIEPFAGRNLRAFGYDMSPEPVRWAAAVRAWEQGEAALSGKVTLQQEGTTDIQPGFLMFLPVYRPDGPRATLADRRANLVGWTYSPLRMGELMHGVLGALDFDGLTPGLQVEVYDGDRPSPETRLFALQPAAAGGVRKPQFRAVRELAFGGHRWSLAIASTLDFEARQRSDKATAIAVAGSVVSLLLAIFVWVQTASRLRIAALLRESDRMQAALREQAIRDPLTGLLNRRYLDETLPRELARCRRTGESLAVAMLDLDHFKALNDTSGHEAGDKVLRAVGELLRDSLRSGDLACRYGGEELTLILPGASLKDAHARLEALREAVALLPVRHRDGNLPPVTVSVGLAAAAPHETDAAALLGRADAALYLAKAGGRNRVALAEAAVPLDVGTLD